VDVDDVTQPILNGRNRRDLVGTNTVARALYLLLFVSSGLDPRLTDLDGERVAGCTCRLWL